MWKLSRRNSMSNFCVAPTLMFTWQISNWARFRTVVSFTEPSKLWDDRAVNYTTVQTAEWPTVFTEPYKLRGDQTVFTEPYMLRWPDSIYRTIQTTRWPGCIYRTVQTARWPNSIYRIVKTAGWSDSIYRTVQFKLRGDLTVLSKFADDTKLCHRARNPDDIMELQEDINKLVE